MNIVGLKELVGQAMLLSFVMLFIAYIICRIADEHKQLKIYKNKEKSKKLNKIRQEKIYSIKFENEIRKALIRQCQGII